MCMLNQSKSKCQSPPIPCWPRSLRPVCCQVKSNKTPFPLGGATFTIALQFTPISMSTFLHFYIFIHYTFVFSNFWPLYLSCSHNCLTIYTWTSTYLNVDSEVFSPEFKIWNCILELKSNKTPFPLGGDAFTIASQFTPELFYFHTFIYFCYFSTFVFVLPS